MWVEERKIASIGVHVAQHVTTHGFAVNVDNDMRPFEWAVACGLHGVQMTSLADERGETALTRPPASEPLAREREPSPALAQLADHVVARFAAAFDRTPVEADPPRSACPRPPVRSRRSACRAADPSGEDGRRAPDGRAMQAPLHDRAPSQHGRRGW